MLAIIALTRISEATVKFNILKNGSYSIDIDATTWLNSAATAFQLHGARHSTEDGSLVLEKEFVENGYDKLGGFKRSNFMYSTKQDAVLTSVRIYENECDCSFAVFSQVYLDKICLKFCNLKRYNTVI